MHNPQLENYIKTELSKGTDLSQIRTNLKAQGWKDSDIELSVASVTGTSVQYTFIHETKSPEEKLNSKAETAFYLSIIGLIFSVVPILGLPLSITGLVYALKSLHSQKHKKAIIAVVLTVLAIMISIVSGAYGAYFSIKRQMDFQNRSGGASTQSGNQTKYEFIQGLVESVKSELSLPQKLDQYTMLVDITAHPEAVRFHYEVRGLEPSSISTDVLRKALGESICANEEILGFLKKNINVEYYYTVAESGENFTLSFNKQDCGLLSDTREN